MAFSAKFLQEPGTCNIQLQFYGCHKVPQNNDYKLEPLAPDKQTICFKYIRMNEEKLFDVLSLHLHAKPDDITRKGKVIFELTNHAEVIALFTKYTENKDKISVECTNVLLDKTFTAAIGIPEAQFQLHLHLDEQEKTDALAHFPSESKLDSETTTNSTKDDNTCQQASNKSQMIPDMVETVDVQNQVTILKPEDSTPSASQIKEPDETSQAVREMPEAEPDSKTQIQDEAEVEAGKDQEETKSKKKKKNKKKKKKTNTDSIETAQQGEQPLQSSESEPTRGAQSREAAQPVNAQAEFTEKEEQTMDADATCRYQPGETHDDNKDTQESITGKETKEALQRGDIQTHGQKKQVPDKQDRDSGKSEQQAVNPIHTTAPSQPTKDTDSRPTEQKAENLVQSKEGSEPTNGKDEKHMQSDDTQDNTEKSRHKVITDVELTQDQKEGDQQAQSRCTEKLNTVTGSGQAEQQGANPTENKETSKPTGKDETHMQSGDKHGNTKENTQKLMTSVELTQASKEGDQQSTSKGAKQPNTGEDVRHMQQHCEKRQNNNDPHDPTMDTDSRHAEQKGETLIQRKEGLEPTKGVQLTQAQKEEDKQSPSRGTEKSNTEADSGQAEQQDENPTKNKETSEPTTDTDSGHANEHGEAPVYNQETLAPKMITTSLDYDPPTHIPPELQGLAGLIRVYIDRSFGEMKRCQIIYSYDGKKNYENDMHRSSSFPRMWYIPVGPTEGVLRFHCRAYIKRGTIGKLTSYVYGRDDILEETTADVYNGGLFAHCFNTSSYLQRHHLNNMIQEVIIMTASNMKRCDIRVGLQCCTCFINDADSSLLKNLCKEFNTFDKEGKSFLIYVLAIMLKNNNYYIYDIPNAKDILQHFRVDYTFDVETLLIPFWKVLTRHCTGKTYSVEDFVTTWFPLLSLGEVHKHLPQGRADHSGKALDHILRCAEYATASSEEFHSLIHVILSKMHKGDSLPTIKLLTQETLSTQAKQMVARYLTGLIENLCNDCHNIDEVYVMCINVKGIVTLGEFAPVLEKRILGIIRSRRSIFKEESVHLMDILQIQCCFKSPSNAIELLKILKINTPLQVEVLMFFFNCIEFDCNVAHDLAIECLNQRWKNGTHDRLKRIVTVYNTLEEIGRTKQMQAKPEEFAFIHKFVKKTWLTQYKGNELVRLTNSVSQDEKMAGLLQTDVLSYIVKGLDLDENSITKFMKGLFTEKGDVCVNNSFLVSKIKNILHLMLDKLQLHLNKNDLITLMDEIIDHAETLARISKCTGVYDYELKGHRIFKFLKKFAHDISNGLSKMSVPVHLYVHWHQKLADSNESIDALCCYEDNKALKAQLLKGWAICTKHCDDFFNRIRHLVQMGRKIELHLHDTNLKSEILSLCKLLQELEKPEHLVYDKKKILDLHVEAFLPPACLEVVTTLEKLGPLEAIDCFWATLPKETGYGDNETYIKALFVEDTDKQYWNITDYCVYIVEPAISNFNENVNERLFSERDHDIDDVMQLCLPQDPQYKAEYMREYVGSQLRQFEEYMSKTIPPWKKKAIELFSEKEELSNYATLLHTVCGTLHVHLERDNPLSTFLQHSENQFLHIPLTNVTDVIEPFSSVRHKHGNIAFQTALCDEITRAKQLISFLQSIKDADLRNLIDAVEEYTEEYVQESTVSDFIQTHQTLIPVLALAGEVTLEKLLCTLDQLAKSENRDVMAKLRISSENFHSLKALYMNVSNRGEVTKQTVENIARKSRLKIDTTQRQRLLELTYKRHEKELTIRLAELHDLKSRAHLISNTGDGMRNFSKFIELVETATEIMSMVDYLCESGHFDFQNYTLTHKYTTIDIKLQYLRDIKEVLNRARTEWLECLHTLRREYKFLNFVYSEQLPQLYNFIETGKGPDTVLNILKFISPSTYNTLQKPPVLYMKLPGNCVKQKLETVGKALDAWCKLETPTHIFPFDYNFTNTNKHLNGQVLPGKPLIASHTSESSMSLSLFLTIYATTSNVFPLANQVLTCHVETQNEEVEMLLQRCLLRSAENMLHAIVFVEKLKPTVLDYLAKRLSQLTEAMENESFRLALIFRATSSHPFIQAFPSFERRVLPMTDNSLELCLKHICNETACLVTSEVPGLGKTEYVLEQACKLNRVASTVHVSGRVSKQTLVNSVPQWLSNAAYHFDISDVYDCEELDNFLFEFIVLKCAVYKTHIVHMLDIPLFLEVANSVGNTLRNNLSFFSKLQRMHITWDKYKSMKVSTEPCSPIQVTCSFLQALGDGSIGNKDIILTGAQRNVSIVPPNICVALLQKYFSSDADMSYSIVNVFIEVLSHQLKKLSVSHFFRLKNLGLQMRADLIPDLRSRMILLMVNMAKDFACRSVHVCRSSQSHAILNEDADFSSTLVDRMKGMIQWADSNHFAILFNSIDRHTITPLYRNRNDVDKSILCLIEGQLNLALPDFVKFDHTELHNMLQKLVSRIKDPESRARVEKALPNYALTPDNLIKMVLIQLRIDERLPVIIMGETGCGKTSLVQYLALTRMVRFHKINFHAGTSESHITTEILKLNDEAAKSKKETWVFLDEINTCLHLGIINQVVCRYKLRGKALTPHVAYICACNPYRLRRTTEVLTAGLKEKAQIDKLSRLVYRVHPLPESMMDFVWDYGVLHEKDECRYIQEMVRDIFNNETTTMKSTFAELITASHNFIRKHDDNYACVSLRDANRCRTLYAYFIDMQKKKGTDGIQDRINHNAIFLALNICYGVRLHTSNHRQAYYSKIAELAFGDSREGTHIAELIYEEEMDILQRMTLPSGIAKNKALRENVFVLFVCIMNRMPIFLVGKPGSSKSLSMQLLKNSLRGLDSKDPYLRKLPQLYVVSYQGSEASTSEGILKVFDKAKRYLEHNKHENVLPVVLLDEVGLAEVSSHNPLKILHSLLEPDNMKFPDVSVVGISNWALDAAKMNRAIHLSRTDLSEEELMETAESIYKDYVKDTTFTDGQIQETLRGLSKGFFRYRSEQKIQNFHGLRDFYCLIRHISRDIAKSGLKANAAAIMNIIHLGVLRNFGGVTDDMDTMEYLIEHLDPSMVHVEEAPSRKALIEGNITDFAARNLLVITKGDFVLNVLVDILGQQNQEFEIILGSRFAQDRSETYQYRILSQIIHGMECGKVLILKDLNDIYGSLYDMLNQNYTIVGGKRNCRIALGPHSNPLCQIDEHFKCIVILEEDSVDYSDPPFLNRFEKQHLTLRHLLSPPQNSVLNRIQRWITQFCDIGDSAFETANTFIGVNAEYVTSLVYHLWDDTDENGSSDHFPDKYRDALLRLVTMDGLFRLQMSKLCQNNEELFTTLQQTYFSFPYFRGLVQTLTHELNKRENQACVKCFAFTFSTIHSNCLHILGEKFRPMILRLEGIKTEQQLAQDIDLFWSQNTSDVLILQFKPSEAESILHTQLLLDRKSKEWEAKADVRGRKSILILLHLEANCEDQNIIPYQLSCYDTEWSFCLIENLESNDVNIQELSGMSLTQVIKETSFFHLGKHIENSLHAIFTKINYQYGCNYKEIVYLLQRIPKCKPLVELISRAIQHFLEQEERATETPNELHWQVEVACDPKLRIYGSGLIQSWKRYIENRSFKWLQQIVFFVERHFAWDSILIENPLFHEMWENMFWKSIDDMKKEKETLCIKIRRCTLVFPFSKALYDKVRAGLHDVKEFLEREESLKDIESIEGLSKQSIYEIIERYQIIVQTSCNELITETELHDNFDDIKNDMLRVFVSEITECSDAWVNICKCFIAGHHIIDTLNPSQHLTIIFLASFIASPHIQTLAMFARQSNVVQHTFEDAITNYYKPKCATDEAANVDDTLMGSPMSDVLVRTICRCFYPSGKYFCEIKKSVPLVLAFCARLSVFPVEIHFLRVCNDMLRICPQLLDLFLENIARIEWPSDVENILDTEVLYTTFKETTKEFRNAEPLLYQEMWSLYFQRCFDANDNSHHSHVIGQLIKDIPNLPEESLCFIGRVLHKIIQLEIITDENSLLFCWQETPTWNNVMSALDSICYVKEVSNLLVSIIEEVFHSLPDLKGKLQIFGEACRFIELNGDEIPSLSFCICVGFCKACLRSLADEQLMDDVSQSLGPACLHKINAGLIYRKYEQKQGITSSLQLFFLRCLHSGTMKSLAKRLTTMSHHLVCLREIKLSPHCFWPFTAPGETLEQVKDDVEAIFSNDDNFQNRLQCYLEELSGNAQKRYQFFLFMAVKYFWIKVYRELNDSERTDVENILKLAGSWSETDLDLLLGLFGKTDFQCTLLHISSQSSDAEIFQAQLLLNTKIKHLMCCKDSNQTLEENLLREKYICFTADNLQQSCPVAECDCNTQTIAHSMPDQCDICKTPLRRSGKIRQQPKKQTMHVSELLECPIAESEILNITDRLVQVVLLIIFLGYHTESKQIKSNYLVTNLKQAWDHLNKTLNLSNKEIFLLIRHIIQALNDKPNTARVQELVVSTLNACYYSSQNPISTGTDDSKKECEIIQLLEGSIENDTQSRWTRMFTSSSVWQHIHIQAHLNPKDYDFLCLIVSWEKKLKLIHHINCITEFTNVVFTAVNHKLDKAKCQDINILHLAEKMEFDYEHFLSAWNDIRRHNSIFKQYLEDSSLPKYSETTRLLDVVCKHESHPISQVLKALVNWQNAFLDCSALCALNGCRGLEFLVTNDSVVIPRVLLHKISKANIIMYDRMDDMMNYAQIDARDHCGYRTIINMTSIQMDIANDLLLGKVYIEFAIQIPTFNDEMPKWSSNVFHDIEAIIRQEPLHKSRADEINDHLSTNSIVLEQLTSLITVALWVVKTRCQPDDTIGRYMDRWKIPKPLNINTKIEEMLDNLGLQYIVAFHEVVEQKAFHLVLNTLPDHYTSPLDATHLEDLKNFEKMELVPTNDILHILQRFVMRYLWDNSTHRTNISMRDIFDIHGLYDAKSSGRMMLIKANFPQSLTVRNICALVSYYKEKDKPLVQNKLHLLKSSKQDRRAVRRQLIQRT